MVTSAAETARALATSGALDRCMAMNFINYALTECLAAAPTTRTSAARPRRELRGGRSVIDRFAATDRSFASLMRAIAASDTLALRSRGQ